AESWLSLRAVGHPGRAQRLEEPGGIEQDGGRVRSWHETGGKRFQWAVRHVLGWHRRIEPLQTEDAVDRYRGLHTDGGEDDGRGAGVRRRRGHGERGPRVRHGQHGPAPVADADAPRRGPGGGAAAPVRGACAHGFWISRVALAPTANVGPPISTTHARRRCAPGRTTSTDDGASLAGAAAADGARLGTTASSAGKLAYHAQELVGRERFGQLFFPPPLLAPPPIPLLLLLRS